VRKKELAEKLLVPLRQALLEKYKDVLGKDIHLRSGLIPLHLNAYLEEKASELESEALKQPDVRFHSESCMKPRDDLAAMQEAARDLVRLERYQRRAWSRLKSAIRRFLNLKLNALLTRAPANTKSFVPSCG
jgi:hypothetical protein